MSDLSNFINLVDGDMNLHSTYSIANVCCVMVKVVTDISSSSGVPFSGVLFIVCLFVHYFIRQLTLCCFFW